MLQLKPLQVCKDQARFAFVVAPGPELLGPVRLCAFDAGFHFSRTVRDTKPPVTICCALVVLWQ